MVVEERVLAGMDRIRDVRCGDRQTTMKQRYLVLRKLGQGTYGKVQLAINKETNEEVAVKTIKKTRISNREDMIRIRREIKIMSTIRHPNIIHIHEVFETKERIVLVMQYASGGELYDYLGCHKKLPDDEARRIFRQIAAAIYYCHKNQICHRDLKLENILLDEEGNTKIADFGLSNIFDGQKKMNTFCGSALYASPEIVKGTPYHGPEVDCWSLGVLLFALVYGTMPFDGKNFRELVSQISIGNYNEPDNKSSASDLIRKLLTIDATKRADIYEICRDEWLNHGYPVSLLQQADSMSLGDYVQFGDFNLNERQGLRENLKKSNSMLSQSNGSHIERDPHFRTVKPESLTREYYSNTNHIPNNQYLDANSKKSLQGSSVSNETDLSIEIALALKAIIDEVVYDIEISGFKKQRVNSVAERERRTVEKLLKTNGITQCRTPIPISIRDRFDVLPNLLHDPVISGGSSSRQSIKILNSSSDELSSSCGGYEENTINSCFSKSSKIILDGTSDKEHIFRNSVVNQNVNDLGNTFLVREDVSNRRHLPANVNEQEMSQKVFASEMPTFFDESVRTDASMNRRGRKSSNLLFLQASRRRANSLCKTLAFTFECGMFSDSNKSTTARKLPGKVEIPKNFDSPESTHITEKERLLIFPCVSVSEGKEIIQKKIERVKKSALNIMPRRNSDVTRRSRKKKYTRSQTEVLPGAMSAHTCNDCLLQYGICENCSDFFPDVDDSFLENAHLMTFPASENYEDDEINLMFSKETCANIISGEDSSSEFPYLQENELLSRENIRDEVKNHVIYAEENANSYFIGENLNSERSSHQSSCNGSIPVQDMKTREILRNINCTDDVHEDSNISFNNQYCSHKRRCQSKKSAFFLPKQPFRKCKSEECQCISDKQLLCGENKYATTDQLSKDCERFNSYCSDWSISTKSCCSCSIGAECDILKKENNFDHFCANNTAQQNCESKLMFEDLCFHCKKYAVLHDFKKFRLSSSAPDLANMPEATLAVQYRGHSDNRKLFRSLVVLDKLGVAERRGVVNSYSCKNIYSRKEIIPICRDGHEMFQTNGFDDYSKINGMLNGVDFPSLHSRRVLSDADVRCHKPRCNKKSSLDHYRNLAEKLAYESQFLEYSDNEMHRNKKKRSSSLPRKMSRDMSTSFSKKTDHTMKLNALKRIQEAEYELSSKSAVNKVEETEKSESLLEALKMHGYRNVISSRFKQNNGLECDIQDSYYYSGQTSGPMLSNGYRLNYMDNEAATLFGVYPSTYSYNIPRNKKSKKLYRNGELTLQRKQPQYDWNRQLPNDIYYEDPIFDVNDVSYTPQMYNNLDYPIFSIHDVNKKLLNSVRNKTNSFRQRTANSNMPWESEFASGVSQNANPLELSTDALYSLAEEQNYKLPDDEVYKSPADPTCKTSKRLEDERSSKRMGLDEGSSNSPQTNEGDKEESVSHRIWRKSFYSRFNNRPLSKRTKTFSLESDVFNDSRLLKIPERAYHSLDIEDYESKDSSYNQYGRTPTPLKSFQSLDETFHVLPNKSEEKPHNSRDSDKYSKTQNSD